MPINDNNNMALIVADWRNNRIVPGSSDAVSANEVTSLSALIAYVAHRSGRSEFHVERGVADRFSVPNVKCLPSAHYDKAIRYLVDNF